MLWEPRPLGTGDPKEAIQLPLSACPPPTHLYGHRIMSPPRAHILIGWFSTGRFSSPFISTVGALRRLMTYDNHPIHPIHPSIQSLWTNYYWPQVAPRQPPMSQDELRWTKTKRHNDRKTLGQKKNKKRTKDNKKFSKGFHASSNKQRKTKTERQFSLVKIEFLEIHFHPSKFFWPKWKSPQFLNHINQWKFTGTFPRAVETPVPDSQSNPIQSIWFWIFLLFSTLPTEEAQWFIRGIDWQHLLYRIDVLLFLLPYSWHFKSSRKQIHCPDQYDCLNWWIFTIAVHGLNQILAIIPIAVATVIRGIGSGGVDISS